MYNPAVAIQYETQAPLAPRAAPGPYRAADYFALPDEPRCELLYGSLFVTPAPAVRHQSVLFRLAQLFGEHADRAGDVALFAPVDVVLADHTVVQPDFVYVQKGRAAIVRDRIEGAPDLVVEILSPATARRDLGEKLRLYAESGIADITYETVAANGKRRACLCPPDPPMNSWNGKSRNWRTGSPNASGLKRRCGKRCPIWRENHPARRNPRIRDQDPKGF